MSEVRSSQPDRSPSSYYGAGGNLREKIETLLAALDPEVRQAIMTLAKADPETRRLALEKRDPKTRALIEAILANL